jgi:uncharacterized protein YqcC (DUF446 family)
MLCSRTTHNGTDAKGKATHKIGRAVIEQHKSNYREANAEEELPKTAHHRKRFFRGFTSIKFTLMSPHHIAAAEILIDIERELRVLQLWEAQQPPAEALASTEPFAVDTLNFAQWLQFIFIPRMYMMIEAEAPLPNNCGVAPMAEQYFSVQQLHSAPLIAHLQRMDVLLTRD